MKTIYISGIIGMDVTADGIREEIDSKSTEKLRVIVNSPGGLVGDGFEIFNILKAYSGNVEMIIGVMAGSVASYIAMVAPKENRKAFKNSSFMIHEASGIQSGRARDFKIRAERLEGLNNIVAEAYAEGLEITKEDALSKMSEDFYMTGWEALTDNNVISEVIDIEDVDIPQKEEDEEGFAFFTMLESGLQKEPDESELKAIMYEAEDKIIKDYEKQNIDMQKAVALIKDHKPVEKPVEDNKNPEEDKMDLNEVLKSNPEAQAEFEKLLESAEEKGKESVMSEIQADRERVAEVLELEGVQVSEEAISAIEGETTVSDYMKERLLAQKENREKVNPKKTFGNLKIKSPQTPAEQANGESMTAEELDEKFAKEAAKNVGGEI